MKILHYIKYCFLVFVILFCSNQGYCSEKIIGLGIKSDILNNFNFDGEVVDLDVTTYVFKNENDFLQIEKMQGLNEESANVLIDDDIIGVNAIYANFFSAYPGEISNEVSCDEKFRPIFVEKKIGKISYKYFLMHSTSRFGIGACSEDIIEYKHLRGWIYCAKNMELYTVKYFVLLEDDYKNMEDLFLSFSCDGKTKK